MTDGFGDQVRKLLDPAGKKYDCLSLVVLRVPDLPPGFRLAAAAENGDAFMRVLQVSR